jgi:hypothetical protein
VEREKAHSNRSSAPFLFVIPSFWLCAWLRHGRDANAFLGHGQDILRRPVTVDPTDLDVSRLQRRHDLGHVCAVFREAFGDSLWVAVVNSLVLGEPIIDAAVARWRVRIDDQDQVVPVALSAVLVDQQGLWTLARSAVEQDVARRLTRRVLAGADDLGQAVIEGQHDVLIGHESAGPLDQVHFVPDGRLVHLQPVEHRAHFGVGEVGVLEQVSAQPLLATAGRPENRNERSGYVFLCRTHKRSSVVPAFEPAV